MNNATLLTADPRTHVKVVISGFLSGALVVALWLISSAPRTLPEGADNVGMRSHQAAAATIALGAILKKQSSGFSSFR